MESHRADRGFRRSKEKTKEKRKQLKEQWLLRRKRKTILLLQRKLLEKTDPRKTGNGRFSRVSVNPGEVVALMGSSCAGKTSSLNILAHRINTPSSGKGVNVSIGGDVFINGNAVTSKLAQKHVVSKCKMT